MKQSDTYKTIQKPSEGIFKDKGSKFIAYALPVVSEEEIKEHLTTIKKNHHSARHHCYAYRLGYKGEQYRINDDGEPSGTAGKPIYGQLLSYNITNILIVVVRYFGGTLLGVSGLINAYKKATIDVLNSSEIVEKTITERFKIVYDYNQQSVVSRIIKENNIEVEKSTYTINCTLYLSVRLNNAEKTFNEFSDIEGITIDKLT
jgi:uncharacterized YigZ family protein